MGRKLTKQISGVGEVEDDSGRQWPLCLRLPTSHFWPPTLPLAGQELRFPRTSTVWHQPETSCWRPLGSQDQRLKSLPRRVHPARVPQSEARASPPAAERAGGEGGRSLAGFPAFKRSFPGPPGALTPFVSGVGTTGQKRCPCASLSRSGPLPASPGKRPRSPGPSSAAPSPHPAGSWGEGPGGWGPRSGSGRGHWPKERREARATHRAVAAPPGPARSAREAAQVRPRRRREFESRSRQGLRLPAAPAHGPAPRLPRTRPAADAAPGDPSPRAPFQRRAGSRGRASGAGAAAGGRRAGGAGQEFFQWVETRAGRWNPAIGGFAGTRRTFATRRAAARGEGDPAQLMINARRWGERAAQTVTVQSHVSRSPTAPMLADTKTHVVGVTPVSQPNTPIVRLRKGDF